MTTIVSRVFMNGSSQAVRIPHQFRLDTGQVVITRNADGDLVLHAMPVDRGAVLLNVLCGFFTFAELLKGAQRSTKKTEVIERLNQLIRYIRVEYAVERTHCEHYAVQFNKLRDAGTPIGANDLWIACHALALDRTLVTNNLSAFMRVLGLPLANWVDAE